MSAIDTWTITNTQRDAQALAQHNSVFTISNGYLGLTGNLCEDRDGPYPLTIINGVFDDLDMFSLIRASKHERPWLDSDQFDTAGRSPAVANLPNPLFVRLFVGDREVFFTRNGSRLAQEFDLRSGVYRYTCRCEDDLHGVDIETSRLASLKHPDQVYMRYTVTPHDDGLPIRVLSGIDGHVRSNVTGERQFSVVAVETAPTTTCRMSLYTPARGHRISLVVEHHITGAKPPVHVCDVCAHDAVYTVFEYTPESCVPLAIERFVNVQCSPDSPPRDLSAPDDGAPAGSQPFDVALAEQRARWATLWERADVQIDGDERAQQYLRFCLYHLLAAAPWHTDKLSVPVKLLSGQRYQGSTFWDTDLYIEPCYVFTFPELARTCLNYRYEGLSEGRKIAQGLGFEGAKLAWQAGPYGEECLGTWYHFAHTNIHINADVCYSLLQYYWATGDEAFMREKGVDILVESARFYASRATYDEKRDAYDIHDVAGPDEAHCHTTNNFYTNYLVMRTLRSAADVVARLREQPADAYGTVAERLALGDDEPERWRRIADRLTSLYDPYTKIYEQCESFHDLPPPPVNLLDNRRDWFVPLYKYQALNQPDVVMAMVLFREDFLMDVRRANWEYYKDKSMNFSSMSFAINAIMAADLGEMEEAYRNFMISAGMDLDESLTARHDTHMGLHGTAMGGAWMAAVFGFGGVCLSERGLRINPNLPAQWRALRFNLVLRDEVINVSIDRDEVMLTGGNEAALEMPVRVAGRDFLLRSGQTQRVRYRR